MDPAAYLRAVGRFENPGVPVLFGGHYLPPMIEIGLNYLPKSGGSIASGQPRGQQACHQRLSPDVGLKKLVVVFKINNCKL